MARTYARCPDCGRRGIHLRSKPMEGDVWLCRYCEFFVWADGDGEEGDRNRARLRSANTGEDIGV